MDFEGAFFDTEDYQLTDTLLGEGSYGKVYVVISLKDNAQYAAKIINSKNLTKGSQQMMLIRESGILHRLNHPAVVKFIGINFHSFNDTYQLEPTIITEYLKNGSLRKVIDDSAKKTNKNWNATKKYICLLGIADAMRYLHEQGVIHRDLKPENVLIDADYYPRVCDFGLSKCFIHGLTPSLQVSMTMELGSPLYMAPELFVDDDDYDFDDDNTDDQKKRHHLGAGVDVYAFSILMYEIITEKVPFIKNGKAPRLLTLIKQVSSGIRPEFTSSVTEKMKDLLTRCWSTDPGQRPPFSEIFNLLSSDFSYITEAVDEKEIKKYIDRLKKSRKGSEPVQIKTNSSCDQLSIQKVSLSKLLIASHKVKLDEQLSDKNYYYCFYRCTISRTDDEKVTCLAKVMKDDLPDGSGELRFMLNEIDKQSQLNHATILPLFGVTFPTKKGEQYSSYSAIDTRRTLGDVFEMAMKDAAPDNYETIKAVSIFGIAAGMAYMHQRGLAHCDLNIQNVYLDEKNRPKIYGFYFTAIDGEIELDLGTPVSMAPELFDTDSEKLSKKVDVYAYSIVLYTLLTGKSPYADKNVRSRYKLMRMVISGERPTIGKNDLSAVQESLIKRCWDDDPGMRPSAIQIVKELIDKKKQFFNFSIVNESEFDKYVEEAIQGLDLSLV